MTWQSEQASRYANYERSTTMLEVRPADPNAGASPLRLDADEWLQQIAKEPGRSLGRTRFVRFPKSSRELADATAADFATQPRRGEPFAPAEPNGADTASVPKPVE